MTGVTPPAGERGAALLVVLIMVGVMAALATSMFDRVRLATLLAKNVAALQQARAVGRIGETLVMLRIDDLVAGSPRRTTLAGGWMGRPIVLPLPIGTAQALVDDGGNCFNLNSLVTGTAPDALTSRPLAIDQFVTLMTVLEIPRGNARRIAASAADWIDSDTVANADGAEDAVYAAAARPYRTANTLMAEASELRSVNGVTPELYARLRPWVCALPVAGLSPIDVNTLLPVQAPLIAMLYGDALRPDAARQVIAERPPAGWPDIAAFWNTPTLRDHTPPADVLQQPQVHTNWFGLDMRIAIGSTVLHQTGLIDAREGAARIVARRWTADQ